MKKTAFEFGKFVAKKMASGPAGPFGTNNGNPTALQSYGNTLDRWYNPWSKQQGTERGETGLMRAGQGAMGVAGLAGGALLSAPTAAAAAAPATIGGTVANAGSAMLGGAGVAGVGSSLGYGSKPAAPKPAAPTPAVPK